jgi:hypothetical protein
MRVAGQGAPDRVDPRAIEPLIKARGKKRLHRRGSGRVPSGATAGQSNIGDPHPRPRVI